MDCKKLVDEQEPLRILRINTRDLDGLNASNPECLICCNLYRVGVFDLVKDLHPMQIDKVVPHDVKEQINRKGDMGWIDSKASDVIRVLVPKQFNSSFDFLRVFFENRSIILMHSEAA